VKQTANGNEQMFLSVTFHSSQLNATLLKFSDAELCWIESMPRLFYPQLNLKFLFNCVTNNDSNEVLPTYFSLHEFCSETSASKDWVVRRLFRFVNCLHQNLEAIVPIDSESQKV